MTDDNKQSRAYRGIKKWFLIGVFVGPLFLIFYFTLTDAPPTSDAASRGILNKDHITSYYNWRALLLTIAGITFLPLCYLAATKKLNGMHLKLINGYRLFKSQIQLHEEIKDVAIILALLAAFIFLFIGFSNNCCGWWYILSTQLSARLSDTNEPLNMRYILIGITGTVTFILTGSYIYIADQNRMLDKGRRFDERFDNAADALSKDLNDSSFPAHLGAISGLQALATDSPAHTQRCLDIICSCNQWMEEYIDKFAEKKRSVDVYSFRLLREDNRIAKEYNQNKSNQITLLQEKRSQKALVSIRHILADISTNNPKQLHTLDFHNKMLCGIFLSNLKLDSINFAYANLVAASLIGASLKQANLSRTNLQGASLDSANLQGASLKLVNLEEAYLYDTNLQGVSLDGSDLNGAHLNGANLERASLTRVNLQEASLDGANLQGAHLWDVNLQGASLDKASIQGVDLAWEINLERAFLRDVNLQGVSLNNTNLQGAQLINAMLQGASLDNVNLSQALLLDCNLYGVELKNIKSTGIIFNNIVKIGYIKGKDKRRKYLNDICQHMKPSYEKLFTEKMQDAWQAMEYNQEPEGLKKIREDSIVFKDNQGMYDIGIKDLANLQKRWQEPFNEKYIKLLLNTRHSISSIGRDSFSYIDTRTKIFKGDALIDKNVNLVKKLLALIDQLIESNTKQNNK